MGVLMKRFAAVIAILSLSILVPTHAMAAAPQSPGWKNVSPDLIARGEARQALALEWFAAVFGKGSVAKYQRDLSAFTEKWGKDRFNSSDRFASSTATLASPPSSWTLNIHQYPEQSPSQYCVSGVLTCYCGPSAAESVLEYLQPRSYFGEVLINNGDWTYGQYGLAGSFGPGAPYSYNYLETNVSRGETNWFTSRTDWPMSMSFNYWSSGNVNGFPGYTENPAPYSGHQLTLTEYEADLTSDIWGGGPYNSNGYPLAADVEEIVGITHPHLIGHPTNFEVQHWVAIYGYGASGSYTDYIDPISGSLLNGTNGFNVPAFNPNYSSSMMFTLVTDAGPHGGPFGIAW